MTVVFSDGTVLWIPRSEMQVTCHSWEPRQYNDMWHCPFKFGSWTFDGFKVDLDFYGILS